MPRSTSTTIAPWPGKGPQPRIRVQEEASPARPPGQPRSALRLPLRPRQSPGTGGPAGQDPGPTPVRAAQNRRPGLLLRSQWGRPQTRPPPANPGSLRAAPKPRPSREAADTPSRAPEPAGGARPVSPRSSRRPPARYARAMPGPQQVGGGARSHLPRHLGRRHRCQPATGPAPARREGGRAGGRLRARPPRRRAGGTHTRTHTAPRRPGPAQPRGPGATAPPSRPASDSSIPPPPRTERRGLPVPPATHPPPPAAARHGAARLGGAWANGPPGSGPASSGPPPGRRDAAGSPARSQRGRGLVFPHRLSEQPGADPALPGGRPGKAGRVTWPGPAQSRAAPRRGGGWRLGLRSPSLGQCLCAFPELRRDGLGSPGKRVGGGRAALPPRGSAALPWPLAPCAGPEGRGCFGVCLAPLGFPFA